MPSLFNPSRIALGLAALTGLVNAAHHHVTVGKGGQLKFEPETLTTQPGDTVTYQFFAKNHAVAQSAFNTPCQLQENGIFSGFTPSTSPDVAAPTTFTITVNDTKPLWFYCPQTNGNHCQNGMVHAINAPSSGNTFDAYKGKAIQAAAPSTPPVGTLPTGGERKLHIDVGFNGNLVFNPNNVTELVGTVLEFNYNPANHSIVQSSFDKPCQPLDTGFAAPFFPTKQNSSGATFEVTVKDDKPIWFYCAQTAKAHCQAGMVGSVNAPAAGNKTFDAFKALAATAPPSTIPPNTPLVGTLKVNGTAVVDVGSVLNVTDLHTVLVGDARAHGSDQRWRPTARRSVQRTFRA
ncbi:Cupredoxin [Hypoxylon rubiginosum]|uniref:Cupredoxin n=1 Tax=Hypoxylon rubiginosum TaxID=110542 RepID=A0ACC0DBZ6_9PEZI|nr:Cupredoxin [Hypoxylon rubiginosum]